MGKVYFTSDLHFHHSNIIKYCGRPFRSVEEMNETLINNWNELISDEDEVYVLGDIGVWYGRNGIVDDVLDIYYNQLKGRKYLILGNHDKHFNIKDLQTVFVEVNNRIARNFTISGREQFIVMDHYPMVTWDELHHGSWQLFGHIHSNKSNKGYGGDRLITSQYDVGVDNNNYKPVSLEDIDTIITKQMLSDGGK